jgi:hypothetical protein
MTPDSPPTYYGAYINLDRSVGRRARIEAQLADLGLQSRYSRFPAIDGTTLNLSRNALRPGEAGAFLSHMRALEMLRPRRTPAHILEDDALLSRHMRPVIDGAVGGGLFDRFDILFTDLLAPPHLGMLKGLKSVSDRLEMPPPQTLGLGDLQVIDLAGQNFSCLTSYIVGANSIDRLLALYAGELRSGPTKPVDLFIRDCVHAGKLRAAFLFPFVTSFDLEEMAESTIVSGNNAPPPSVVVLAVLRYLFFADRDLSQAKRFLDSATKENRRPTNPHHDMVVQALEFIVSADFREF